MEMAITPAGSPMSLNSLKCLTLHPGTLAKMMLMFKYIIIKMWAEYNLVMHPIVEVSMKGVIKNDEEFDDFTKNWIELYERNQDFVFVFDTREVGWVSPRYAFKMANFISELKKRERQYLKRSSIIVDSWWVKGLLKLIFAIQSPVCPIDYHANTRDLNLDTLFEEATGKTMKKES